MFAPDVPTPPYALLSPIKLHQHGFHDRMDTTESLRY